MFRGEELEMWLREGRLQVVEARLLREVSDDEPALMGYWVYRKRIRVAPEDVRDDAHERFVFLAEMAEIPNPTMRNFDNVCDAIWKRLSDEERDTWMRSI